MPDTDPNEFTDREQFILAYYRISGNRRTSLYDVIVIATSTGCLILAAVQDDFALGFVAYALVLGRLGCLVVESGKWSREFQGIFRKYEAKLKILAEAQKKAGRDDVI